MRMNARRSIGDWPKYAVDRQRCEPVAVTGFHHTPTMGILVSVFFSEDLLGRRQR